MHMSGVAPVNETLTRELSGVCKACFTSEGGAKKGGVQIEVGGGARVGTLHPEHPRSPVQTGHRFPLRFT